MENTVFGLTEGEIAQFGLTFRGGRLHHFPGAVAGLMGFMAKNLIQWVLGI